MKNKLSSGVLLIIMVFISCVAFSFIPEFKMFGYDVVPIRVFSDIQEDTTKVKSKIAHKKPIQINDSCAKDITCFEDYTIDDSGLNKFYEALYQLQKDKNRKVRIAFFGDSFIEGDIFLGDVRDSLQDIFGGEGVGYMPLTSTSPGYRLTIGHSFKGFESFDLVKNQKQTLPFFISGELFKPQGGNYVEYSGTKFSSKTSRFQEAIVYYQNGGSINWTINGNITGSSVLPANPILNAWTIPNQQSINTLKLSFSPSSNFNLFGISLEGKNGIVVDNFAVRGNPGYGLKLIPKNIITKADELRPYDLIVFQYGLNVLTPKTNNFVQYKDNMVKIINQFKQDFPNSSILIFGISDKSSNGKNTMPNLLKMIDTQRSIAIESKTTFWDLYQGMGGEGTIVKFANHKPLLANKDFTHLTHAGGKVVAADFIKTLMFEYGKYKKAKQP